LRATFIALKNKGNIKKLLSAPKKVRTKQGLAVGAVWVLKHMAKQLGIIVRCR